MASDPLNLDEAGEWVGLWWLPDDPNEKVPGILRYDAEGTLALSLIGAFEDRISSSPAPGVTAYHEGCRTWNVIHGVAEQREVTLLDCMPARGKRTAFARVQSPDKQTVTATTAILGAYVRGEEDAAFSAAEVSVEDLSLWAGSSVFEGIVGVPDGKIDGTGSISVKPVEAQSVLFGGTEYRLSHTHTLPFIEQRKGATIARMRDTVSVKITPAEPFGLSAALEGASTVQDLVALAMHRATGVIWLRLEVAGTESVLPNGQPLPRRRADVLYSPVARGEHYAKAVDPHRVFFTCDDLSFEEVVPRWCETYGRLQTATNMILGLRYAPAEFIESNLLTAVGAAEVLHRNLPGNEKPFTRAKFRAMRNAMLQQVPEEYRGRFSDLIRNDQTLRERLYALAARPDAQAISFLVPDIDCWARTTTRARNDLTHEGKTPNHSFEELIAVVEVTTAIVILNLLHELGLSAERQREIVQQHPQLRATSRMARERLVALVSDS